MRILKMTKRDNRLYSTLEETKKKAIHGLLAVVRCPFLRAKQQKVSIVGDYQWRIHTCGHPDPEIRGRGRS